MKQKIISYIMIVCLLLSFMPIYALDYNNTEQNNHISNQFEYESSNPNSNLSAIDSSISANLSENPQTRASTIYYIAELDDGYLLTSPTSGAFSRTRYSDGNSNSHNLQQWVFVESSSGGYYVCSKTDPSKCLTVNPTTLSVTIDTYTASIYQKWEMYYGYDGNALQCAATDTAVEGYKLVINSNSCSVSNTSYTPVGFIEVSWFIPCTSITGLDLTVPFARSKYCYEPEFLPSNSNCNSSNWLSYQSNNTSICTVDSSGLVTAQWFAGTTTITITHKITRVSCSFTVRVMGTVDHTARIYYDAGTSYSTGELTSIYNSATSDFYEFFCINFNLSSVSLSNSLNGNNCPNTSSSNICNSSCGSLSTCNSVHHKGSSRLLNLLKSDSYYTYRLVSHAVCRYNDSSHYDVVGLGHILGKNALTSTESSPDLECSIQHELTHNLGRTHESCTPNQRCVLKGHLGYWCDACSDAVIDSRS